MPHLQGRKLRNQLESFQQKSAVKKEDERMEAPFKTLIGSKGSHFCIQESRKSSKLMGANLYNQPLYHHFYPLPFYSFAPPLILSSIPHIAGFSGGEYLVRGNRPIHPGETHQRREEP
jgi:hypothetical protein